MKTGVTAFLCLATMACAANASPITYNVNITAGAGQSVTGTITTDGNLGSLAASDFTGVNIFITAGGTTTEVTNQPNLIGQIVNASTSGLSVNFGSTQDGAFFITNQSTASLCFTTGSVACFSGTHVGFDNSEGFGQLNPSGVYTFASVPTAATPEPSGLVLLGTGALSLAGAGWQRLRRRIA